MLTAEQAKLAAHPAWLAIAPGEQQDLLRAVGIAPRSAPVMGTDVELLSTLDACDLANWRTQTDALPTRFANALSAAIKKAEPKARRVNLPPATIKTKAELDAWLEEARKTVESALKDGPVIL